VRYATLADKVAARRRRKRNGYIRTAARILWQQDWEAGLRRDYEYANDAELQRIVDSLLASSARPINIPRMAVSRYVNG